jgi:hypothetical protein
MATASPCPSAPSYGPAINEHGELAYFCAGWRSNDRLEGRAFCFQFTIKVQPGALRFWAMAQPRQLKGKKQSSVHEIMSFNRVEAFAQIPVLTRRRRINHDRFAFLVFTQLHARLVAIRKYHAGGSSATEAVLIGR